MKNSGNENEAKREKHDEQRRGPSNSRTTVTNRSKVNPKDAPKATSKKTKYDKLWVPKTAQSSHSSTEAKVKKTLPSVATLNCLKGSLESVAESETQKVTDFESFHDAVAIVTKIDVSTQTAERPTVDANISCVCEIADKATGSEIPIEYRCSTKSVATTDQWDRRMLSRPELTRDESRHSRDREDFLSSPWSQGRFTIEPQTSWAHDSDLIYDEESHSQKIPIDKPKYVTTCESFGQSTDKSLSISHDFFDAAVGSSIIIEENGKNVSTATERSHDENPRKSVHCEVCTACRQLFRGATVSERMSKPSQFECSSCTNDRQIRDDRNRKRHAFGTTSSEKSQDFIFNPQNISESVISRSNVHKDNRDKSTGQETSIAELKSSRLSKNYRSSNDSMAFLHDEGKARNINEPWNSRPLHESTKLNLESINDFHRAPLTFSESRGSQPRNEQIKLAATLSRSNKNYPEEREINVRTCDFDEVILRRRYKPRSHDVVRPREKESTKKYPIVDKLEPLSNRDSDNALTFNLKEFNQLSQDRDQQRKFLSGCRFSEINNFGKIYDWNKPMDRIVDEILRCEAPGRRKTWKSSNGSVARNKCHCHN